MDWIVHWLVKLQIPAQHAEPLAPWIAVGLLLGAAVLSKGLADLIFSSGLRRVIQATQARWDDLFFQRGLFRRLAYLAPGLTVYGAAEAFFGEPSELADVARTVAVIYMTVVAVWIADAFLNVSLDLYRRSPASRQIPLKSFFQVIKLITYLVGLLLIISIVLDKPTGYLLGSLGALSAVLMLIFKDAILGFVAGIQLTTNRMVAQGDWIEMPNYGADGSVIDISLTTVKVENWDKTITTVPTYALISESFKNWRGMTESGGRRIMRSINLDMSTVRFCSEEMLERFSRIQFIAEYIARKQREIDRHNAEHGVDVSNRVNGRRLTNLGTFRAYVAAYLKNHPMIHQEMTFLVRQLEPTEHGLPLQIYVFSKDKAWANYEAIQADIFDHILAIVPEFDLRVFQAPSGADFRSFQGASLPR